jgi:DNA-binding GntR family transcriptional regulator
LIRDRIIALELSPLSLVDEQVLMGELQRGRTPIRAARRRANPGCQC